MRTSRRKSISRQALRKKAALAARRKKRVAAILSRKRTMIAGQKRRAAVIRLASSMPKGSEDRRVLLLALQKRASAGPITRTAAAKWVETALAELAEEEGLESDDLLSRGKTPFGYGVNVEGSRGDSGESEWMLFEDYDDAEREAIAYVKDMLEDDPGMFNQSFIEQYLSVTDTDARLIGNDMADSYVDDLDEDRVLDEANMDDAWQELEDEKDEIEYGDARDAEDADDAALDRRVKEIEKEQETIVDEARDALREEISDRYEKMVKRDPAEFIEEVYGYRSIGDYTRDTGGDMPSWLYLDVDKAADAAVSTDGVAHFLDSYDGDATELPSGAVAFGTN